MLLLYRTKLSTKKSYFNFRVVLSFSLIAWMAYWTVACSLFVKENDPYELIYKQMHSQAELQDGALSLDNADNAPIPTSIDKGQADDITLFFSEGIGNNEDSDDIIKLEHLQELLPPANTASLLKGTSTAAASPRVNNDLSSLDVGQALQNPSPSRTATARTLANANSNIDLLVPAIGSIGSVDGSSITLREVKKMLQQQNYSKLVQFNFDSSDVHQRYYQGIAYYGQALNTKGRYRQQMLQRATERFVQISKLNSINKEMKAKSILWHGIMLAYYNGGRDKVSFGQKINPFNDIVENFSTTKCYDDAIFNTARLYHLQGNFAQARQLYNKLNNLKTANKVYDVYLKKMVSGKKASQHYLGLLPRNSKKIESDILNKEKQPIVPIAKPVDLTTVSQVPTQSNQKKSLSQFNEDKPNKTPAIVQQKKLKKLEKIESELNKLRDVL